MGRCVFDPQELQEAASLGRGRSMPERWNIIDGTSYTRNCGALSPERLPRDYRSTFNTAGNVVCQTALVYASPVEYVAFFGTFVGAAGFSGRCPWADVGT